MSKLSDDIIAKGLEHEDFFVRSGALGFLTESKTDCGVQASLKVFDVLEKYGWQEAYTRLENIVELPIDAEVVVRLVACLKKQKKQRSEDQVMVETFFEWFAMASPAVIQAGLKDMEAVSCGSLAEIESLDQARFKVMLLDCDAAKCRSLLDESIEKLVNGDFEEDEEIRRAGAAIKRLGELDAIDADLVNAWINQDCQFKDEYELTGEEVQTCCGIVMATQAGIPVPLERCVKLLEYDFDWLSDSITENIVAINDEAVLDQLLRRYSRLSSGLKTDLLIIFERLRFPGREEKLRDLAILEKDPGCRSHLGVIMTYYGTAQGLKYAQETFDDMDGEIEALDIVDILYSLKILNGESSPRLEEWRKLLEEIHNFALNMISDEFDPMQY